MKKSYSFFDVMFALTHAVKQGKVSDEDRETILQNIKDNRIEAEELSKIISPELLQMVEKAEANEPIF